MGCAGLVLGLVGAEAVAAPQVLGLVASNGPIPLTCEGDVCRADLSSFCLQQPRDNPDPGARYTPADSAVITLVGRTAAGETVRLTGLDNVSFASERGFTAVEAAVARDALAKLGLVSAAIEIGANASLVPVEQAGDDDAQTADEIALATGAHRAKGAEFFDDPGESSDAIRLASAMINALPRTGRQPSDSDGRVLQAALGSEIGQLSNDQGRALAESMYATCVRKVDVTHHIESMRSCIAGSHDRLVVNTNVEFWKSLASY